MITLNEIKASVEYLANLVGERSYQLGLILGSGYSSVIESIDVHHECSYQEIPNFAESTVEGHSGTLIFGSIAGVNIIVLKGRFHYYEGYTMGQVTLPIRVLGLLGIKSLIVTNAAGGINLSFRVGDIMVIKDHINLFPENPLRGRNIDELGERFPSMTNAYDISLREMVHSCAQRLSIDIKEGVYVGFQGPSYETPAEYCYLRTIGADAVGMSTVPEVIVARHQGIRCIGISLITNTAADAEESGATHEEVLSVAEAKKMEVKKLIEEIIAQL